MPKTSLNGRECESMLPIQATIEAVCGKHLTPPKQKHYLRPSQQTRSPDTNAQQSEDFTTLAKRESTAVGITNVQTMGGWSNVFRIFHS